MNGKSALVTGCSSGIGRAIALHLDAEGWNVVAGVRDGADFTGLAAEASDRLVPIQLDVTDAESVAQAARTAEGLLEGRGLDALVNNAGTATVAPLEAIAIDDLRDQLELNTIGQIAVTQAMLPLVRLAQGRIVFITSMGGRVSVPLFGPYCASKFALEAMADALRGELAPWNIDVIAVEPGSIDTPIWKKGSERAKEIRQRGEPLASQLYSEAFDAVQETAKQMADRGIDAGKVADTVTKALGSRRPRTRYLVGADARALTKAHAAVSDRVFDFSAIRQIGLPRRSSKAL